MKIVWTSIQPTNVDLLMIDKDGINQSQLACRQTIDDGNQVNKDIHDSVTSVPLRRRSQGRARIGFGRIYRTATISWVAGIGAQRKTAITGRDSE